MGGRPSALDGEPAALAVRIDNAVHEAGLDLQATPELSYREMLDEALSVVEGDIDATATGHLADRCRLLAVLSGLREELAEHHFQRRLRTYSRVQDQLVRLRSAESVDAVVAGAPQAVCEAGDFDRSAIYRVRGSDMLAEATYIRDDPETAREYLEFSRDNPAPLQEQILESEMVRRRIPMLVPDALQHPRTFKPMVEHYQTHCYVAAPIMPEGRVIGFLHADRALRRPNDPDGMDEFDRDVLWAFAEGLGYVIERAHLVAQLRSQAAEVESLLARTRSVVTEYMDNRVQMISDPGDTTAIARSAAAILGGSAPAVERILSRREREVLQLVADGATNAQIATKLFITESTAKAHVGRILRKLGAGNRVEATALYHRARG